jgi:hypothetical protein
VSGREVDNSQRLLRAIRRYDPEDEVEVVVLRRGEQRTFTVKLGDARDFSENLHFAPKDLNFDFDPDFNFGFNWEDLHGAPHIYRFDDEDWGDQLKELHESLREIHEQIQGSLNDELREKLRHELRGGMEEARRAMEKARRAVEESHYD